MLELRRDGLADIADALRVALGDQDRREGTDEVAKQMQVFLASDVIDTLRFRPELFEVLRDKELSAPDLPSQPGSCPTSSGCSPTSSPTRSTPCAPAPAGPTATPRPGLHGNGVAAVSLGGVALTPGRSRRRSSWPSDLAFEIQVQNQGENTENDVVVRVTVGDGGDADEPEETIDTIAPGEIKTVTIPLADQPPTGQNVPITVEVEPVPGEQKTDNNTLESSVIFTR